MKDGDVFSAVLSPSEPKSHFWVVVLAVISEDKAVCCNITSYCFDKTTPVYSAEYSELTQDISYINYPQARIEKISSLEDKINKQVAHICPPVSKDLLKQILEGALKSKYTPNNIKLLIKTSKA